MSAGRPAAVFGTAWESPEHHAHTHERDAIYLLVLVKQVLH